MFDAGNVFSTFNENSLNGYDLMIMDSMEKKNKLFTAFKQVIQEGHNPELVQYQIYQQLNISPTELIDVDRQDLEKEVQEMYKHYILGY